MKNNIRILTIILILSAFIFPATGFSADKAGKKAKRTVSVRPVSFDVAELNQKIPEFTIPNLNPRGSFAYGENLWTSKFYNFDVDTPTVITVIDTAEYFALCGDFAPGDTERMWIIDYPDNVLKTVNINTGEATYVANFQVPLGDDGVWTSLSVQKTTGQFYAIATNGIQSVLYGFNPETGAISSDFNLGLMAVISSSFDLSGNLFVFELETDSIFSLDIATGIVTGLGYAGFDGNYAQGMGYDPVGDEIYLAAYVDLVGPQLRKLDRLTGNTTLMAGLPGETAAFSFPMEFSGPLVNAGPDATNCEDSPFYLVDANAENYEVLEWRTSGDGTFDDDSLPKTTYTPGVQDLASGGVELCITALEPDGLVQGEDCMHLSFQERPTADAGGDFTIIAKNQFPILSVEVSNYSSLLWTTSGDGYFDQSGILNPVYNPGQADLIKGQVNLCLVAGAIEPCSVAATSCMVLTILTLPSGIDFGDAPEIAGSFMTFPTTLSHNGAAHNIDPEIFLGEKIDGEADGQPSALANGDDDDLFYPSLGDDEDGVTLPGSFFQGTSVTINVKASVNGYLDVWMDFDLDHTWFNPTEHIFNMQPLVAGNNALTFIVPATAAQGQSFLRFRFRDYAMPLSFDGFANNGEVEDYMVVIKQNTTEGWDFGDAPKDTDQYHYPTLLNDDGARHYFVPGIFLGAFVDVEPDGQPVPGATGDDTDKYYPSLGDDEEGVSLPSAASPGSVVTLVVTASVEGYLDAWMDFDLDGKWVGTNEHIFNLKQLTPGANPLTFTIPANAVPGNSYLRFRFRTNSAPLSFTGAAENGEVEDYMMQIAQLPLQGWDFGDAPENTGAATFPTLLNTNGARHRIVQGIHLGAGVDAEPNGQPAINANGDDQDLIYPSLGDDEDGVTFTGQLVKGSTTTINVTASVEGYLDAWMDFNADGSWSAENEHIFVSQHLPAGANNLAFAIPATASTGGSYLRFRFRDYSTPINYFGEAENGEVEDYKIEILNTAQPPMDFGDAPESTQPFFLSYPTTLERNGAAHIINTAVYLGSLIDAEPNGQPDANANGDDLDLIYPSLGDDEDGVVLPANVVSGSTVTITVNASVAGYLDAWMDFNLDFSWFSPDEHIFTLQPLSAGANTLSFFVPSSAVAGKSYLRFRFRNDETPLSFDGIANNGEVEDYTLQIEQGQATGWDFGDAPDGTYPTLLASNGARHANDGVSYLGYNIDIETNGIQSANAKGDDQDYLDDEDGVQFVNPMFAGGTATIQVQASVGGYLNTWMDFDKNGDWAGAGDQVFTDQWLNAGMNTLSFTVPTFASMGNTFTRFRFSSQTGLTFNGLAQNGEVEDYQVTIYPEWDYIPTFTTHIFSIPSILPQLQSGDMLGVFFTNNDEMDQCAGTMVYSSGQPGQVIAFGDDLATPGVKEGFDTGEPIQWKLFSANANMVFLLDVTYDLGYPDNDGNFRPFGFSALTAISYQEDPCGLPAGWEFEITGQVHSINIPLNADPNIFGEPLNVGDWIGVFYIDDNGDEACGGAVQWNEVTNVVVNAYGDDPYTTAKDGFDAGETLMWKLCKCGTTETFAAEATYNDAMPCQGNFGSFCLSELMSIQALYFQNIPLFTGWNSISSYLVPSNPDVENIFAPHADQLIIIKNLTSLYWPYAGVNTIGNWDNMSGYAIKVSDDIDLKMGGVAFSQKEITLSAGWHYLPVMSSCPVNATELFAPVADKITLVQDIIGTKVWWPEMGIYTLQTLLTGKAYKIRTTGEVTLTFPECNFKTQTGTLNSLDNITVPR